MKYVRSAINQSEFEEYVTRLDDDLYNWGLSAVGTSPDNLKIVPIMDELKDVKIDLEVELDSDGENKRYYFMPVITLPTLDSRYLHYADSIMYYLDTYTENLGKFAKRMISWPYVEGMFDE